MIPLPDTSLFDDGPNNVERCGLILVRPDCTAYIIEVPNRSETPNKNFVIMKSDLNSIKVPESHRAVGIIHTHPYRYPRLPSPYDISSLRDGLIGMVYHPSTGSTTWYDRTGVLQHNLRKRR
jgi:proteasome lid subunit RPN8/RPN11